MTFVCPDCGETTEGGYCLPCNIEEERRHEELAEEAFQEHGHGTTLLPNRMLRYDCCGNTGGTPLIDIIEDDDGNAIAEHYHCPHCKKYQGRRELHPGDRSDDRYRRAFNHTKDGDEA